MKREPRLWMALHFLVLVFQTAEGQYSIVIRLFSLKLVWKQAANKNLHQQKIFP